MATYTPQPPTVHSVSGAAATAERTAARYVPVRRERSRDIWVASSLVLTKKEPMMEQTMPHTAISMGRSIPA